jgi:hypothetical protein
MLRKRTAPTDSPETFVCAAIDPACCCAGRPATDNKHSVLTRVAMAVTDPAVADYAAVLLGCEGRTARRQNHQRHGKAYRSLHESHVPVRRAKVNNPDFCLAAGLSRICRVADAIVRQTIGFAGPTRRR